MLILRQLLIRVAFGGVLGLTTLSGCSPAKRSHLSPAQSGPPVTVARAVSKDIPVQINAIGHVNPFSTVAVRSQVDGELERVLFKEGDEARAGQSLFAIDPRPFQAALHQAEANLAKDEALATNAVVEERRNASLWDQQIISQDTFDQVCVMSL